MLGSTDHSCSQCPNRTYAATSCLVVAQCSDGGRVRDERRFFRRRCKRSALPPSLAAPTMPPLGDDRGTGIYCHSRENTRKLDGQQDARRLNLKLGTTEQQIAGSSWVGVWHKTARSECIILSKSESIVCAARSSSACEADQAETRESTCDAHEGGVR